MANKKTHRDTLLGERWALVPGTNGAYSVSTFGRVYSNRFSRFLKLSPDGRGYYSVRIFGTKYMAHRVVAWAFLGLTPLKCSVEINHKDGNKTNNCLDNLEIVTHSENMIHALNNGLWNPHPKTKESYGPISKRLRYYVCEILKENPISFIRRTGAHHSILNGRMKSIKDKTLEKITSIYPVNPNWVRHGEGDIELDSQKNEKIQRTN